MQRKSEVTTRKEKLWNSKDGLSVQRNCIDKISLETEWRGMEMSGSG